MVRPLVRSSPHPRSPITDIFFNPPKSNSSVKKTRSIGLVYARIALPRVEPFPTPPGPALTPPPRASRRCSVARPRPRPRALAAAPGAARARPRPRPASSWPPPRRSVPPLPRAFGRSLRQESSVWSRGRDDLFSRSRSLRDEDDEEALRWAALEKLPTYDRARTTVLAIPEGELKEVNVDKLGAQQRIASVGDDHECFLSKFKDRVDRYAGVGRGDALPAGTIVERPIRLASLVAVDDGGGNTSVSNLGNHAGYYCLPTTHDARLFYFFFESRRHKKEDPVVIWLTGGPGCSSELALFYENGPFHIAGNMSLLWNEFGWDQPTGTGFSYSSDSHDTLHNEASVYQLHSANYRERRRYKMENHGKDHEDALKDVEFREQPARVDLSRLAEIADTEKAASQMQYFVKHWEYRRANNARLLNEELGRLSQQQEEIEQKKQQIMEKDQRHNALKCSRQEINDPSHDEDLEEDAEHDSTPTGNGERCGRIKRMREACKGSDVELRYRYIFNHFPTLADEDVIGKTDHEILSGEGIDEMNKVKREVMAKVKTREKMADIRVREAVQKAKETKHSRSPNITEDTPQAKQMLATMSHEIGSPLSEVLRIAELLATTKLDQEQHQLLELMLSSGNVVLQSIDGILGLSKVESGVIKLQSAIFRPREVVEHVLQTASSFMKKELTLEGRIGDDVPSEVIGDALKIQEILTNLISFSNAVKFTQDGKVGINLNVVDKQQLECQIEHIRPHSASPINAETEYYPVWPKISDKDTLRCSNREDAHQNGIPSNENSTGEAVWLRFDVYDIGIGIAEVIAVSVQEVDLMGGTLTVLSKENEGSTFTVMLPCIIPARQAQ
ncbi:Histidine kinase 5 [Hordeum vulgare]|nr:Histidine kinase 5 [Hordeum vulgare]